MQIKAFTPSKLTFPVFVRIIAFLIMAIASTPCWSEPPSGNPGIMAPDRKGMLFGGFADEIMITLGILAVWVALFALIFKEAVLIDAARKARNAHDNTPSVLTATISVPWIELNRTPLRIRFYILQKAWNIYGFLCIGIANLFLIDLLSFLHDQSNFGNSVDLHSFITIFWIIEWWLLATFLISVHKQFLPRYKFYLAETALQHYTNN